MNTTYFKYLLLPAALLSTVSFAQELDEEDAAQKVNVAFRSVPQEDLLGGVSVLDYEELAAKNNNTYSLDNMQGYVSGFNGASLWGQTDYLVLVDGVPRDADNVKPDEIAQVTFMKGAQAVVAVQYLCTSGDTYAGNAVMTNYSESSNASDEATLSADFKVTGTFTKQ